MIPSQDKSFIDKSLIILAVTYIFVSFGLSGMSNLSRLSSVSALLMAFLLLINKRKIQIKIWVVIVFLFYVYLLLPSFALRFVPYEAIFGTTTVFIGTTCISILFTNRILSLSVFAYTVLASSLVNVVAVLVGIDTTPLVYGGVNELRATGFLGNANTLAVNLCLAGFAVWMIDEIPVSYKIASILSVVYGILVSGSMKSVVLGFVLILFIAVNKIKKMHQGKTVAFGMILISICYFYLDSFVLLINEIFSEIHVFQRMSLLFSGQGTSFYERKTFYEIGIQIWKDAPLFGEGLGQFAQLSASGEYSHNNYIELLVSGGILALALYYILYLLIIYYALRSRFSPIFNALLIVAMLVFTDSAMVSFVARSNMLFVVFALWYFSQRKDPKMAFWSSGAPA